jgi:ATP-dependent RNA helicase RhlE
MRFEELGLGSELLRAIEESGYTQPTPIQERAIPSVLEGKDVMCCAQTGTGKTAAFALPILQRLSEKERKNLRALVLVPTRELAIQVGKSLNEYGKYLNLVSTTAFGGVPIEPQQMMLRHGVDILVATPGRLIDHMWRGNIDYRNTEYLVLDEADRMLDMGFIKDVTEIIREIPTERQSMLFSATLDREIVSLAKNILRSPVRIEVAPPSTTLEEVDQFLVRAERGRKRSIVEDLIRSEQMTRAIVFVRTKAGASNLARHLKDRGIRASAMHGDRSQSDRVLTLEGFRAGRIHILVATDIAARGLDVDDVSHVVNYDLPYAAEDYVHRIGRTARAGRRGMAISLVGPEDAAGAEAIERLIVRKLAWMNPRGQRMPAAPQPVSLKREPAQAVGGNGHVAVPGNGNGRTRRPEAAPRRNDGVAPAANRRRGQGTPSSRQGQQPARRQHESERRPAGPPRQVRPREHAPAPSDGREQGRPAASASAAEIPSGILGRAIKRVKRGIAATINR